MTTPTPVPVSTTETCNVTSNTWPGTSGKANHTTARQSNVTTPGRLWRGTWCQTPLLNWVQAILLQLQVFPTFGETRQKAIQFMENTTPGFNTLEQGRLHPSGFTKM